MGCRDEEGLRCERCRCGFVTPSPVNKSNPDCSASLASFGVFYTKKIERIRINCLPRAKLPLKVVEFR